MAKKQRSKGQGSIFKRNGKGPWVAEWYDHDGKRRRKTTRTTDKAAAERILNKIVADAALRREGVIDDRLDRFARERLKPIVNHIADYIKHCRTSRLNAHHVNQKVSHLNRFVAATQISRLGDLTAECLEAYMHDLSNEGSAARTVNFARQQVVALANWCVKNRRLESNPLSVVTKLDESRDKRRERRALTEAELTRLFEVGDEHGRGDWYRTAYYAGLRRGDLIRLRWCDIDFEAGTITIAEGKAKRVDVLAMSSELRQVLAARKEAIRPALDDKVFPTAVTARTQQNDFLRAGMARKEVVRDNNGDPVMIGKGRRRRPKTHIVSTDQNGHVVDLHALRTTLGTNLAREGVPPQTIQKIMRHSDYRTTQKHYTKLDLSDMEKALATLRSPLQPPSPAEVSVTDGPKTPEDSQLFCQQLERVHMRNNANAGDDQAAEPLIQWPISGWYPPSNSDVLRSSANHDVKAGDRDRTGNIQLGSSTRNPLQMLRNPLFSRHFRPAYTIRTSLQTCAFLSKQARYFGSKVVVVVVPISSRHCCPS